MLAPGDVTSPLSLRPDASTASDICTTARRFGADVSNTMPLPTVPSIGLLDDAVLLPLTVLAAMFANAAVLLESAPTVPVLHEPTTPPGLTRAELNASDTP